MAFRPGEDSHVSSPLPLMKGNARLMAVITRLSAMTLVAQFFNDASNHSPARRR